MFICEYIPTAINVTIIINENQAINLRKRNMERVKGRVLERSLKEKEMEK